jgi:hypothetical protein
MPTTIKNLKVGDNVYLARCSTQEQHFNKWCTITKVGRKYVYTAKHQFELNNDKFKFNVTFLGSYPFYLALNEQTIKIEMKRVKLINYLEKQTNIHYPIIYDKYFNFINYHYPYYEISYDKAITIYKSLKFDKTLEEIIA